MKPTYESLEERLRVLEEQVLQFQKAEEKVRLKEDELRRTNQEMEQGLKEVFEALKKISSGDPSVRINEDSNLEMIAKLKHLVNLTAEDLAEIVELSHEFAMSLTEHFDVLHRVEEGNLSARVSGTSRVELLESLKEMTNRMVRSVDREIGARKRIEEALRASETQKQAILDASVDMIVYVDKGMRIYWANETAWRVAGFDSPQKMIGRTCHEVFTRKATPCPICPTYKSMQTGEIEHATYFQKDFAGVGDSWWENYGVSIKSESGEVIGAIEIVRNITERKRIEGALFQSEERFRRLIEGSIQGILIHDRFRPLFLNQAYADIHGYSIDEILGMETILPLLDPSERARLSAYKDARLKGEDAPVQYEYQGLRKDGSPIWLENVVSVITWRGDPAIQSTVFDVTKRKRAEEALQQYHQMALQTEKMSALGRMAAGIAHEINNPLAGILLYSSNMRKKVNKEEPLKEGLDVIINETQRCKGIIQDLLEFSRDKEPEKKMANINDILDKALNIMENEFHIHLISVEKDLSGEIPDTLLDVNMMRQVFVNLFINALEAMEKKGVIRIKTLKSPKKNSVRIDVSDTGCGIPEENLPKLFEPFFSTKAAGTGLGLALSYGIVRNHRGDIRVSSEPGKGTRFTIEIPIHVDHGGLRTQTA